MSLDAVSHLAGDGRLLLRSATELNVEAGASLASGCKMQRVFQI